MFTKKALLIVNTHDLAANGTGPPFLFILDKMPDPELPYVFEIGNHAHAILGSIALIQFVQPGARKTVATEAVFGAAVDELFAIFDSAGATGFRFEIVISPATGACMPCSCMCAAEATVHSAGSNQPGWDRLVFGRSF